MRQCECLTNIGQRCKRVGVAYYSVDGTDTLVCTVHLRLVRQGIDLRRHDAPLGASL